MRQKKQTLISPVLFSALPTNGMTLKRIEIEPLKLDIKKMPANPPAIIVARTAIMLPDHEAGIIDTADIISFADGDWDNAILVVFDDEPKDDEQGNASLSGSDEAFLESVKEIIPDLAELARTTIDLIRSSGVEGKLVEKSNGRWVNSPVNSFTLKAQPRAKNLQFTLYGNPSSYEHHGFLKQDQNSYSRGWVKNEADARTLATWVAQAHARRTG